MQIVLIFILSFDFKNLLKSSMKSHFFYLHLLEFTFHLLWTLKMNSRRDEQHFWSLFCFTWQELDCHWHNICGKQCLSTLAFDLWPSTAVQYIFRIKQLDYKTRIWICNKSWNAKGFKSRIRGTFIWKSYKASNTLIIALGAVLHCRIFMEFFAWFSLAD